MDGGGESTFRPARPFPHVERRHSRDKPIMTMLSPLMLALVAMFLQQSFSILAQGVIPLVAPAALPDLGVPPSYVGVFVGIYSVAKIFVSVGCGNVIRRYGGIRVSQAGQLLTFAGLAAAASGQVWPFAATAILLALGTGAGTPASSHILAAYAPPKLAPLIFSVKQTAVPIGLACGGVLVPFLVGWVGWQGALLIFAILCALFAFVLQPLRNAFDADRVPDQSLGLSDLGKSLILVWRNKGLRLLGFTMFAFVGLQVTYMTYLVLFLTESLGFTLTEAGGLFGAAMAASIPTRILWGIVAGTRVGSFNVLAGIGFGMAVAALLTSLYAPGWTYWQLFAVAALMTSTALGWQGVLLSEIARLSPPGMVGPATGGVLAFSSVGQVILPLTFSAILQMTGGYNLGFSIIAGPALAAGVALFVHGLNAGRSPPQAGQA